MIFNSTTFIWIFLPILLILHYIVKDKYKNILLVIASLIFYAWGEPLYVILLIGSILINYILGIILDKSKNQKNRKILFVISLILNIGLLCYFKYYNFLIQNINRIFNAEILKQINIALPIGISFFTFSAISYMFDLYRKDVKVQKNIINLALYISFFPKLIMGPIEKYSDFEKQIEKRTLTSEKVSNGIKRFVYGLAKKVIIANSIGYIADYIFDANLATVTTPIAWIGAICYMLQIFYDFSGYSDMAIGLAKMFGFDLMENFNLPYISQSITEFWRRWHISLSTWFKNYLYIPLGGNRKGKIRTYINLFIVFFTTGIWHGSSWNFIAWGLFNGLFMIIERIKLKEIIDKNRFKIINHFYALFVTLIGWVLFRANGLKSGIRYLKTMFIPTSIPKLEILDISNLLTIKNILIIIIAILLSGLLQTLIQKNKKIEKNINKLKKYTEPIFIIIIFAICIMSIIDGSYSSFIYFKF